MSESTKILLTLPSGEVRKYGLQMESIRIGRAADNTVVIEDPSLSAHHCVLRRVGAGSNFSIEDLESTNGIEVNGEETTMAELSHGNIVKIGEIMMIFMQAGQPALDPLEPFVKKEEPTNDDDFEETVEEFEESDEELEVIDEELEESDEEFEESDEELEVIDEELEENDEEISEESNDTPAPPQQKKVSKPKSTAQQSRQDYVQVEESGGCGSAIVSLLILLLAPVVGLCVHHYLTTGRFLILDLISGSGQ